MCIRDSSIIGHLDQANTLTGSSQNDIITGGDLNDILNGGAGTNTVSYINAGAAVSVDLSIGTAQNTGGGGSDTLSNFNNLTGSDFNDTLLGDSADNIIEGGAGDDVIDGAGGSDTASYASAASGVSIDLAESGPQDTLGAGQDTLSNIENLIGSAFDDTLFGDSGNNILTGGDGDDVISGGIGADTIDGGDGIDTGDYTFTNGGLTVNLDTGQACLLYTSPSPRDATLTRMPSSA